MQHRIISLTVALVCAAIVAACGISQSTAEATPPTAPAQRTSATYVLTPGQSVELGPNVSVKLERVNDSRCKKGAVCVWAGYVSYSFVLTNNGVSSNFVLAEDMPGGSNTVTQQGLRFTLGTVEPAEPPAMHAPPPAYRVSFRVDIS
ncbi:hypothetical protein [Pseudoduganella namucuonensis]|uniref:DUF1425 domain-containing protein n=1 Tax=Pseudoduganella namucuonensis TaxID=1035707 RepID=A0A1I7EY61_9BURK|nr:hypothetical protein [Pseudoduganella namucuonensis]SFU28870.1 hypothetical protein SAMN05216552_1001234 [Pseudoduganella namucuonensis]